MLPEGAEKRLSASARRKPRPTESPLSKSAIRAPCNRLPCSCPQSSCPQSSFHPDHRQTAPRLNQELHYPVPDCPLEQPPRGPEVPPQRRGLSTSSIHRSAFPRVYPFRTGLRLGGVRRPRRRSVSAAPAAGRQLQQKPQRTPSGFIRGFAVRT